MTQVTLREYLHTTEDAIGTGRIDEAMANCQNILTYFPEALEAQRLLGEVYLAQGQLEEAQQTFEWILTNDPENVIVYCDRALISERISDIDTALDCYQQAYELSRGSTNSTNIRQEFNQLSVRAGQSEFMFSRAGLARLYMRGDLLTQAVQEWDAVLAISPERLDARLGLMETHWREGNYGRAEQIALQLLDEIPTCLKALLYMAHMSSISNLQHAREYVRRAEALDPELFMAQEIFADLAASQPNDPFLSLIAKESILLQDGVPVNVRPAQSLAPLPPQNEALFADNASSGPFGGDMLNGWDTYGLTDQALEPSVNGISAQATRSGSLAALDPLGQGDQDLASWQAHMDQSALPAQEEQPWYQNITANADPLQNWENLQDILPATQESWDRSAQPDEMEDVATPPAWLDTLTKKSSSLQDEVEKQPSAPLETAPANLLAASRDRQPARSDEDMPFFLPTDEEGESEDSWPDWLKSLGAESLEPEEESSSELPSPAESGFSVAEEDTQVWQAMPLVSQSLPAIEADPWTASPPAASVVHEDTWTVPEAQPTRAEQYAGKESSSEQSATPDWMHQLTGFQSQESSLTSVPDWMQQLSGVDSAPYQEPTPVNMTPSTSDQEQRYIASLEYLEKDLQSQGFVPLAPGTLASLAQTEGVAEPVREQPRFQEESSLSSALAQLGNFSLPPAAPAPEVPWWSSTSQVEDRFTQTVSYPAEQAVDPFAAMGAGVTRAQEVSNPLSPLPATPLPTPPAQLFDPGKSGGEALRGSPRFPAYRSDALLDSDLETTMKRPAINLQPMQEVADQLDQAHGNGKGRSERKHGEQDNDTNLSNHDHLVKGYHYQLEGDYDSAMQEYRLLIRNAPELLDDVISNTRALLKFNPRFSLGYRVLGDAYMRKGEYLQAMESYNKALTMAKKARS